MDYASSFAVSAAGMALERTRVEVATLNLANAHTVAAPGQAAYTPMRVVGLPAQAASFAALMLSGQPGAALKPDFRVEPAPVQPRMVLEPGHPLADARGFVSYPAVDPAAEMVTLMGATRAYEANIAAMNTARTLALKALDIGGNA
ncbi:flagellar basal body rod protein FlgC [Ramlibacter sp.]|uniref:flagellar basal body rod protein FlgC n=1 Tax=Ramlibacter sp. TaxID=1917967 RepID=UPI001855E94E|nr:flagellar basal body rod protein FlgC [Ramlibacter sp.]MBA2673205.1 flagellar basal body rod protein FlgC [Ramlibacter sp.]